MSDNKKRIAVVCGKGTGGQLEAAIRKKLQSLGGEPIESSISVRRADASGTGEDLLNAAKQKLTELSGESITSAQEITSARIADDDVNTRERYIHDLIGDVESAMIASEFYPGMDRVDWHTTDDAIIILAKFIGGFEEITVPFADLQMDFKKMEEDVKTIMDGIFQSPDVGGPYEEQEDVTSATKASWDIQRVGELVDHYLQQSDVPSNTLVNLVRKQMEKEGGKLPHNITDLYDEIYRLIHKHKNVTASASLSSRELAVGDTVTLSQDYFYDVVTNIEEAGWDEVIEFAEASGWVSEGQIIIPAGTTMTLSNRDRYFDSYSVTTEAGTEIVPFNRDFLIENPLVLSKEAITSSFGIYDDEDEEEDPDWEYVKSKSVRDSDDFMTDYTMYRNKHDGTYIFMFGDNEIYLPDPLHADYTCETEAEAEEWFDSYTGFEDAEDGDFDFVDYSDDDEGFTDEEMANITGGDRRYCPECGSDRYYDGVCYKCLEEGRDLDVMSSEEVDSEVYSCDKTAVNGAFESGWYFGKEQADEYGDLICEHLSGKTVSKRRDTAEEPGGLIYEANQLGIDMWDLLGALEGLCYQGRAREIDDSTYRVA